MGGEVLVSFVRVMVRGEVVVSYEEFQECTLKSLFGTFSQSRKG